MMQYAEAKYKVKTFVGKWKIVYRGAGKPYIITVGKKQGCRFNCHTWIDGINGSCKFRRIFRPPPCSAANIQYLFISYPFRLYNIKIMHRRNIFNFLVIKMIKLCPFVSK